ncbi:uncharacterized protein LOC135849464 [Planococcus citri]|uniref:uncharacterized protein LOC135849464 n=1 Tax=Planococcus citri TaxID=170843 RepID=UPI0031F9E850
MNLTDILNRSLGENLSYENNEIDHLSRPRRSTNETAAASNIFMTNITAPKSKDITPSSSSNRLHNVTSSSSNTSSSTGATKDLTKRSFYPGHSLNHGRARTQQPEMTQAIMEENPNPSEDYPAYHRRSSIGGHFTSAAAEDDEQHDIEDFFRKNVPIYDGVPIARRGYQGSSSAAVSPKKYYHFSPSPLAADGEEEEEEEDGGFGGGGGKPMKGLLEVDHDEDMDHEYVPMKVNHLGKQIVMEDEVAQDEEADDQPLYPYYPAKNYHHHTDDDDSGFYSSKPGAPSSHPYPFENSYSSAFKSSSPYHYHHQSDYPSSPSFSSGSSSPFSSAGSPSKYGTSHQYNSLADQQPRYYKHFKPSIPYPAHDDDDRPAAPSYSSYSSPTRLSSYPTPPTRSTYYNNHDFVPKRAPSGGGGGIRGAYASKYPTRSTHVPQTLEEYHRLHGTFDTRKKNANPRPYSRPIIVPQDDNHKEEDEEEEKDKDTADYTSSRGPKSFVSLNFGTTGTSAESDDEGVSVRHEIGHHFKPRKPYFRPALPENTDADDEEEPQHQEYQVEYPSESISGSTKYRGSGGDDDDDETSPGAIKNFVESVFKQNKNYDPDIVVGKKSHLVSPYNPHFGERVKQKTPEQNLLWHRKSSDARVARDKQSRDKNDRLLHEENIKMYDSLVKEVTMKPAKRDADTDDRSQEDEDEQKTSSTLATPVPQETQTKPTEVEPEDDKPQFKYWSKTSSEPN